MLSTSNSTYSNEGDIYQDINGDGDIQDSVEIINITYVASENLGQFDSVNVNVNLNNETTIFEFNYETFRIPCKLVLIISLCCDI